MPKSIEAEVHRMLGNLSARAAAAVAEAVQTWDSSLDKWETLTHRLEAILSGSGYVWSEFDSWGRRFAELRAFPELWANLKVAPDPGAKEWERSRYERAKYFLLGHTLYFLASRDEQYHRIRSEFADVGAQVEILRPGDEDPCPVCRLKHGTRFNPETVRLEDLPPFHPGCRCTITPHLEG